MGIGALKLAGASAAEEAKPDPLWEALKPTSTIDAAHPMTPTAVKDETPPPPVRQLGKAIAGPA